MQFGDRHEQRQNEEYIPDPIPLVSAKTVEGQRERAERSQHNADVSEASDAFRAQHISQRTTEHRAQRQPQGSPGAMGKSESFNTEPGSERGAQNGNDQQTRPIFFMHPGEKAGASFCPPGSKKELKVQHGDHGRAPEKKSGNGKPDRGHLAKCYFGEYEIPSPKYDENQQQDMVGQAASPLPSRSGCLCSSGFIREMLLHGSLRKDRQTTGRTALSGYAMQPETRVRRF